MNGKRIRRKSQTRRGCVENETKIGKKKRVFLWQDHVSVLPHVTNWKSSTMGEKMKGKKLSDSLNSFKKGGGLILNM